MGSMRGRRWSFVARGPRSNDITLIVAVSSGPMLFFNSFDIVVHQFHPQFKSCALRLYYFLMPRRLVLFDIFPDDETG